jgi:hypothetical protein
VIFFQVGFEAVRDQPVHFVEDGFDSAIAYLLVAYFVAAILSRPFLLGLCIGVLPRAAAAAFVSRSGVGAGYRLDLYFVGLHKVHGFSP